MLLESLVDPFGNYAHESSSEVGKGGLSSAGKARDARLKFITSKAIVCEVVCPL